MELEVGAILEGKITGITKFGAFVALPGGKSGLVHISNISNSYVSNVSDFLTVGQEVRVKVLDIGQGNRVNLSIRHALPQDQKPAPSGRRSAGGRSTAGSAGRARSTRSAPQVPQTFEDKLKRYMAESESKLSQLNRYNDRGRGRRRRS